MNPKVEEYLGNAKRFNTELRALREILLECGLIEEYKWRTPCYTFQNTNMIILGEFKDYCVLSFLKGVLLQDSQQLLIKPGENSQSVRFLKFTDINEINALALIIKSYIFEALEIEKLGLKVDLSESKNLIYPLEFQKILEENPDFKHAFESLTQGRKRAYNMFFSEPKQSKTRESRVYKYMQQILNGKGIHDCTCGLSKRPPSCDGSHKHKHL